MTSVADFSFRQNYGIVFDQLVAPTAAYIKGPELERWFRESGLEEIADHAAARKLLARPGAGSRCHRLSASSDRPTSPRAAMTEAENSPAAPPTVRMRIAQALGLLALVASLVAALGPAERVRTMYSWPPASLPADTPSRVWYTPLLLVTHQPEILSTDVPCTLPPTLPSGEPGLVLATARYPDRVGGLAITQSQEQLVVSLGGDVLDRVDLPRKATRDDCAHRITFADGRWTISGGDGIERTGRRRGDADRERSLLGSRPAVERGLLGRRDDRAACHAHHAPTNARVDRRGACRNRRPASRRDRAASTPVGRVHPTCQEGDRRRTSRRRGGRTGTPGVVRDRSRELRRRLGHPAGADVRLVEGVLHLLQQSRRQSAARLLARVGAPLARRSLDGTDRLPFAGLRRPDGGLGALSLDRVPDLSVSRTVSTESTPGSSHAPSSWARSPGG